MAIYIGIMTGNSMDGIDAVAVDFPPAPNEQINGQVIGQQSQPIPLNLTHRLRQLAQNNTVDKYDLLQAENTLTELCARTVHQFNLPPDSIAAIGCHGQTIAHAPAHRTTWQLLNGALLAEQTGVDVICDFRRRDLATGGQGAPLAPLFHAHYFAQHRPCNIVNIGGIANLTRLGENGSDTGDVQGWDTGPGMILIDEWQRQQGNFNYAPLPDSTLYDADLLATLLKHPYLSLPPPKSCGREQFNLNNITLPAIAPAIIEATLIALTATTIAAHLDAHPVYLCGGGARNARLVDSIATAINRPVFLTDTLGLDVQYVEAAAFAWLAKMQRDQTPLPTPSITGGKPRIAGAHYPRHLAENSL